MTDQEFIQLLNEVAKKARPFNSEVRQIDSMDMILKETGLDSLDMLMCTVYLCEIYDVEDEKSKEMLGETPQDLFNFLKEWGRRQPADLDQAREWFVRESSSPKAALRSLRTRLSLRITPFPKGFTCFLRPTTGSGQA